MKGMVEKEKIRERKDKRRRGRGGKGKERRKERKENMKRCLHYLFHNNEKFLSSRHITNKYLRL